MVNRNSNAAFTLVESLIYIGIVSIVVTGIVVFSITISNTRTKTYVVQEVQANTRVALDIIEREVRTADGIITASSSFGIDPGRLVLRKADPQADPTVIYLEEDDGHLMLQQGESDPLHLTSKSINITELVFQNISSSSDRVRISLMAEFDNPSNSKPFEYQQSLQTAVSVRK